MNDEGLADAAAANPFRLPRLHPDFRYWAARHVTGVPGCRQAAQPCIVRIGDGTRDDARVPLLRDSAVRLRSSEATLKVSEKSLELNVGAELLTLLRNY